MVLDAFEMPEQFFGEVGDAAVSQKNGYPYQVFFVFRQFMGLAVVNHLEAVFDAAMEIVGLLQIRKRRAVNMSGGGQPLDRR